MTGYMTNKSIQKTRHLEATRLQIASGTILSTSRAICDGWDIIPCAHIMALSIMI